MDDEYVDIPGPAGPAYPFLKLEVNKLILVAFCARAPCQVFWQADFEAPRYFEEVADLPRHDVFVVVGDLGNGPAIYRLDIKVRLAYALRGFGPICPGCILAITRSGSGKQTQYAIKLADPLPETHVAFAALIEQHLDSVPF